MRVFKISRTTRIRNCYHDSDSEELQCAFGDRSERSYIELSLETTFTPYRNYVLAAKRESCVEFRGRIRSTNS